MTLFSDVPFLCKLQVTPSSSLWAHQPSWPPSPHPQGSTRPPWKLTAAECAPCGCGTSCSGGLAFPEGKVRLSKGKEDELRASRAANSQGHPCRGPSLGGLQFTMALQPQPTKGNDSHSSVLAAMFRPGWVGGLRGAKGCLGARLWSLKGSCLPCCLG